MSHPPVNPLARSSETIDPAAIIVSGGLIYLNSLSGPFIFDDTSSIRRNDTIQQLSNLRKVLVPPRETPVAGRPTVRGAETGAAAVATDRAIGALPNAAASSVFRRVHTRGSRTLQLRMSGVTSMMPAASPAHHVHQFCANSACVA